MKTNNVKYTTDRVIKTSAEEEQLELPELKDENPVTQEVLERVTDTPEYDERVTRSLEEQKNQANFLFQIISHVDGRRSEPFVASWDAVTEMLKKHEGTEVSKDDYLLLVATLEGENTRIPATPIIKVSTFLDISTNNQEEE